MIKNSFTKIGDHLLMCDAMLSNNGELIKVTSSDKLILSFMYHRWYYFTVEKKKEYRDSQEYIALRTGNNVKTVERCISKFTKSGILVAEKRFDNHKKHNKWFWLSFTEVKYVRLCGDSIKDVISESISDYIPTNHYFDKINTDEIPEHISLSPPDFDMLVPDCEYDNNHVMSMWEENL